MVGRAFARHGGEVALSGSLSPFARSEAPEGSEREDTLFVTLHGYYGMDAPGR